MDAVAHAVAVRVPHAISTLRHRLKSPVGPAARTAVVVGIIRLGEDALLREVAPGHWSACHFAEQVIAPAPGQS